jgi:hypothetical protein
VKCGFESKNLRTIDESSKDGYKQNSTEFTRKTDHATSRVYVRAHTHILWRACACTLNAHGQERPFVHGPSHTQRRSSIPAEERGVRRADRSASSRNNPRLSVRAMRGTHPGRRNLGGRGRMRVEHRAVRRVLDSYVFGYSLYQVCEVQRSASEIHRAPAQIGLTGTLTVSTKVRSWEKDCSSGKGFL